MSGNALVSNERPWILDRRADVEVPALRVVGRDEIESARVGVVDSRRIHEPAGTRGLECLGQLTDLEPADVFRDRDQPIGPQEVGDLHEPRFVRPQKVRLVRGDARRARGIGRRV